MGRAGGALAAAALVMMAAGPALADPGPRRDRDGRRHERRHHDDNDGGSVGGFLLGALLAGGLVAALTKKKAPEQLPADVTFVPVSMIATEGASPGAADREAAVAACVASAEAEARRTFPIAQAGTIHRVDPVGPGFAIAGDLLLRTSYRELGERHAFRCSVGANAVSGVSIEGLAPAS